MSHNFPDAASWAGQHLTEPYQIDCVTTIMLKILDGKCKMADAEKELITRIYQVIKHLPGKLLGPQAHALIAAAQASPDDSLVMAVYEQRLLAETMLTRPVMKAFKAMLKQQGLLGMAD